MGKQTTGDRTLYTKEVRTYDPTKYALVNVEDGSTWRLDEVTGSWKRTDPLAPSTLDDIAGVLGRPERRTPAQ